MYECQLLSKESDSSGPSYGILEKCFVLHKFSKSLERCGVWESGTSLSFWGETILMDLRQVLLDIGNDERKQMGCRHLFVTKTGPLVSPNILFSSRWETTLSPAVQGWEQQYSSENWFEKSLSKRNKWLKFCPCYRCLEPSTNTAYFCQTESDDFLQPFLSR